MNAMLVKHIDGVGPSGMFLDESKFNEHLHLYNFYSLPLPSPVKNINKFENQNLDSSIKSFPIRRFCTGDATESGKTEIGHRFFTGNR